MSIYFRMFEHLLPRARAWQMKLDGKLRQFFEGLEVVPQEARDFVDGVWGAIWPDTTTELELWEAQFGLPDNGLTETQRRDRLNATWAALGGQDPRYIQDVLQANGFDVYLHEWWELPAGAPPVAHDPRTFLSEGGPELIVLCGEPLAECGEPTALLGQTVDPLGYPLVNKIATTVTQFLGAGDPEMECDEPLALLGQDFGTTFSEVPYLLPNDPALWPYFLYVGAPTFPDQATVDAARRDEFEDLLLTISPGQQWLGVLVDYV